ncbi:hypothetical protein ACKKBG_A24580 [Auxenochlorella protothecoides x Auxenochlorella symbiontica]
MPPKGSRGKKKTEKNIDVNEEEEEDLDALWNDGPSVAARPVVLPASPSPSSDDSYFQEENGATAADEMTRAAEDEDEDEEGAESIPGGDPSTKPKLLPALTAFQSVSGPPAFLNPEATRPVAAPARQPRPAQPDSIASGKGKGGGRGDGSWDVSKMAPKLKEEAAAAGPGVIKASAVQYRGGEGPAPVSAAAIALLGGGEKPDRGKPSKAMGVEEFLDKGAGGAVLPRKRQERKDREKDKRSKGQSSHAAWKSEAEMVLRQQYD